jgi:outer membrane protein TolC
MKAFVTSFIIAFFLLSFSKSFAQYNNNKQIITFDQALEITNQNNHVLKQSQLNLEEKNQASKALKGLYLPQIGLTANYSRLSDDITLDMTSVRDAITPLYSTLATYGSFSGIPNPDPNTNQQVPYLPDDVSTNIIRGKLNEGLNKVEEADWNPVIQKKEFGVVASTLNWPLYAGGKIRAANKVADIEKNEATEQLNQKKGEIITELAERYYGLCLAIQVNEVRRDVYFGIGKHLSDAEKMQKEGLINNADLLHAQLYNSQADRELKKSKRNIEIINQSLMNTLSLENNTLIAPASELFYLDTIEEENYFLTQAKENSPLLKQIESKQLLAEQNCKVQQAEFLPAIALQGVYDIANKDLSPYTPDWMVGVGLKWTIFDGASTFHKTKSAKFKYNQVLEIKEKSQSDIQTIIHKYYQELNMYKEQLDELEKANVFAEEYLRVSEKTFHEEMTNETSVVDAHLALAQVSIERLQAMYNYDVTLAKLFQFSGIPEDFSKCYNRSGIKTESYKSFNK